MTLFFSMPKVLKLCDNKAWKIRKVMKERKSIVGTSYILNIDELLNDTTDDFYISSYILLCSYRNYSDFVLLGIKDLDLSYIPDINLDRYKSNPLLLINNKTIKFKYEEKRKK
jgi:hypothetical protein